MKLFDILKGAATVIGTANPLIGAAITVANQFLPDDEKLPDAATGQQVIDKINTLPPDQQASVFNHEIDLKIAQEEGWTERYKAMCSSDDQSSRARIAIMMAQVLVFEIMAFTVLFFWDRSVLNSDAWMVFGVVTGTPAAILLNYFGNLRREHSQRQEVMGASDVSGNPLMKIVASLFNK